MAKCSAIKADNGRCKVEAMPGAEWCWNHHPDYEEDRRRRASKGGKRGGRGRPLVELADVKRQLRELADAVIAGRTDRSNAAVAGQLLGTYLRAVSVELKAREQQELETRIEALELQEAGGRWPA